MPCFFHKIVAAALLTLGVTACSTDDPLPPPLGPSYPVETARMLCDGGTLAEERASTLSMVGDSRASLIGESRDSTETNTILLQKLNAYEAEVEAAYRDVTRACLVHARCLEANGNEERACVRSEQRWDRSSARFASLSTEIRQIDAEVEMARIKAARDVEVTRAKRPVIVPPKEKPACEEDCTRSCDTVQGIFTTGC